MLCQWSRLTHNRRQSFSISLFWPKTDWRADLVDNLELNRNNHYSCITEKCWPRPGVEPRVSCWTYKCSTSWAITIIQFCYLDLEVALTTQALYGVYSCVIGRQGSHMYVGCYMTSPWERYIMRRPRTMRTG